MAKNFLKFTRESLKGSELLQRTIIGRKPTTAIMLSLYVQNYSKLKQNVIYTLSDQISDTKWTFKLVITFGTLFVFLSTNARLKKTSFELCSINENAIENYIIVRYGNLIILEICHKTIMDIRNKYLINDCLIIYFKYDVEPSHDIKYLSNYGSPSLAEGVELCRNFKYLYFTACSADLKIKVRSETFWVHKAILAVRSKLLNDFFQKNPPSQNKLTCISIDEDPSIFHKVLIYIYCGELEYLSLNMFDIYKISSKLQIDILEKKCLKFFESIFTKSSVAVFMAAAKKHKLVKLRNAAAHYMLKNDMKLHYGI